MDRTYVFTVQIDAPPGLDEDSMKRAIYRAIEHACLNDDVPETDVLNSVVVGQITVN